MELEQVLFISLTSEYTANLLHRGHFLHLIDNALLSEEVEIANDEGLKGATVSLKITATATERILGFLASQIFS